MCALGGEGTIGTLADCCQSGRTYIVDVGEGERRQRSVVGHLGDVSLRSGKVDWSIALVLRNGEEQSSGVPERKEGVEIDEDALAFRNVATASQQPG